MQPLAERMRPAKIEDVMGQDHLLGKGAPLTSILEHGHLPSIIFWGPPGIGKTSLAMLLAEKQNRKFFTLSAISAGVKDVRAVIEKAKSSAFFDAPSPVLFIDEIHRFSKSQQDALLGAVEKGLLVLIGATTENPSFEVISALLSRCQVYILKPLTAENLEQLVHKALAEDHSFKNKKIDLKEIDALLVYSGGDARKLYNALEIVISSQDEVDGKIEINNDLVTKLLQDNLNRYDKDGEQHYDLISAFIKSVRGSDPNGAVYWLARMLEGGEKPEFISRRLIILAAEDIGLANPNALLIANTCFDAVHKIGMPEARIILSEATIFLACSPKSNSAYLAIDQAIASVRKQTNLAVPLHLRNAPTRLMKELGYGKEYKYSHDYQKNFVKQEYLPNEISGEVFYKPGEGWEDRFSSFLRHRWQDKYGY